MKDLNLIKNVVTLISRLQNLCEGFDETKKVALLSAKLKILLKISSSKNVSPSILKNEVGLAKSNLAISCNNLIKENLIVKNKDEIDTRAILYNITPKGEQYLNSALLIMNANFENELAYKNNFKQVDTTITDLLQLVK